MTWSLFGHLSEKRGAELSALVNGYTSLFGDTPSRTHLMNHDIDVGEPQPIRQRFYRVSEEKRNVKSVLCSRPVLAAPCMD